MRVSGAAPAPALFTINELPGNPGYSTTAGKTSVSAALVDGENTKIILVAGQSTQANSGGAAYTPSSVKVQNLNPYDGVVYRAADPLLGPTGDTLGCHWSRCGQKLIDAGPVQRPIICNIAVGGTSMQQWSSGGDQHHRLRAAIFRIRAAALPLSAFYFGCGESDALYGTSQASMEASLRDIIACVRGWNFAGPILIAKQSWRDGAADPDVQGAQTAVLNSGLGIFSGGDLDSLDNSYRRDGTHWNATGDDAVATLIKNALTAVF